MSAPPHDYDGTSLTCRRCGAHATQGIALCFPHPDYAPRWPTLPVFLLARIAEDEATAHYATTRDGPTDADFGGWWLGHYQHAQRHTPARVLAECIAKRRIAEKCGGIDPREDDHALADNVLCILALPYADHPDYRDEWRA